MGVPLRNIPAELVDSCRKITRLVGVPVAKMRTETTIRTAVLAAVQPGEDVSVGVVLGRLGAAGVVANRGTVSNELSRWVHKGMLERPARGRYRLATDLSEES